MSWLRRKKADSLDPQYLLAQANAQQPSTAPWAGFRLTVTGIETSRKTIDECAPGQQVGLLFRGVERGDVSAGDVLTS